MDEVHLFQANLVLNGLGLNGLWEAERTRISAAKRKEIVLSHSFQKVGISFSLISFE